MKESRLFPFQAAESQTNSRAGQGEGVGGSDFLAYIEKESGVKGAAESESSTMSFYVLVICVSLYWFLSSISSS